jgi:hypothetical protein
MLGFFVFRCRAGENPRGSTESNNPALAARAVSRSNDLQAFADCHPQFRRHKKAHATVGFPIKAEGQAFLLAASRIAYWRCDATAITLLYTRFLSLDLVLRRKSESGDEEASGSLAPNSFMLNTPLR